VSKNKYPILKGILFSYGYIIIYLVTGLLSTPILLNHFNADYFALLMLVSAIITYLNNIRIGFPESLAALLAKNKDKVVSVLLIYKTLLILVLLVFVTFILFLMADFVVEDWRIILGDVYALNKNDVMSVFYILIIFALLRIPLDLSLSVFIGFHEVYLEKIYKSINLVFNFSLVLYVFYEGISIVDYVLLAGVFDLLVSLISFIHIMRKYKILKNYKSNPFKSSPPLLKSGIHFFQLTLSQTIIWGSGIFLVSHLLTLQEVTVYSLTMKIYIYLLYAFIIINTVVAPLYGKYFSDNNWKAINKTLNLMLILLPFVGGGIWICTLFFMEYAIAIWTNSDEFFIGPWYVLFMGAYFYFTSYINTYISFLYSIGEVKSIVRIMWKEVMLNLFVSVVSVSFFGLVGIAIGITSALILISMRSFPSCVEKKSKCLIDIDYNIQKKHFSFILMPLVIISFTSSIMLVTLLMKLFVFILVIVLYMFFSWKVLAIKEKTYIRNALKERAVFV